MSPSDCLCRCSKVMACIAYVFLGVERTCWLQSFVNVTAELEQDNSPLTVTGRLELQSEWGCGRAQPGSVCARAGEEDRVLAQGRAASLAAGRA